MSIYKSEFSETAKFYLIDSVTKRKVYKEIYKGMSTCHINSLWNITLFGIFNVFNIRYIFLLSDFTALKVFLFILLLYCDKDNTNTIQKKIP